MEQTDKKRDWEPLLIRRISDGKEYLIEYHNDENIKRLLFDERQFPPRSGTRIILNPFVGGEVLGWWEIEYHDLSGNDALFIVNPKKYEVTRCPAKQSIDLQLSQIKEEEKR